MNNDALPDLIVSTGGATGTTSVYLNEGKPATTLTAALLSGASTVQVASTAGFLSTGTLSISGQTLTYTSLTATSFTLASGSAPNATVPIGTTATPSAWQGFASTAAATPLSTPYASALATGNVSGSGFNDLVVGANGSSATTNAAQDELFVNQGNSSSGWSGFPRQAHRSDPRAPSRPRSRSATSTATKTSTSSSATRREATSSTSATAPAS